jgi:hypothetical protein
LIGLGTYEAKTPLSELIDKAEAQRARAREILEGMWAARDRRAKVTVEEILSMRDEGCQF